MSTAAAADERVARTGVVRRLLLRPELGSVIGAVLVFLFFSAITDVFFTVSGVANWLDPASTLGIMAIAVGLLMIGGEFDLSAGVMTGTTGLTSAILATRYGLNIWLALSLSLLVALAIGALNGYLVVRTKLPSFIITLGAFLMLQGVNLGVTKYLTGTVQVGKVRDTGGFESARRLFAGTIEIGGAPFRVSIIWWIALAAVATYLLTRTRAGNWIYAVGGNDLAARSVGVPVYRTKIFLFMGTAAAAWLVGTMQLLRLGSVQANAGIGQEFIYIIAAVIGGCLLTGGYGTAVGAAIGALIFGMAEKGIVYAGWESDWFKFFLGGMLLLAALANTYIRKLAGEKR